MGQRSVRSRLPTGSACARSSIRVYAAIRRQPKPLSEPLQYKGRGGLRGALCKARFSGPDLVAAFIGEPIMQANGVQIPPKSYGQRVRKICSKYGVMITVDEVICCFGRAGHWFVSEYFDIGSDIMTIAKATTAGYAYGRCDHAQQDRGCNPDFPVGSNNSLRRVNDSVDASHRLVHRSWANGETFHPYRLFHLWVRHRCLGSACSLR